MAFHPALCRFALASWHRLLTCAITGRRPRSPASGSDRCSTSNSPAPAANPPTPPPWQLRQIQSPRRLRSRRPDARRNAPDVPSRRGARHLDATTAPLRTTVRLAALPRGPTTVVRRTEPPARARISVISCPAARAAVEANHLPAEQGPMLARPSRLSGCPPDSPHMQYVQISPWNIPLLLIGSYLIEPTGDTVGWRFWASPNWTRDNERTSH